MIEITLKKGLVGKPATQRRIVAALGLHKYGSTVKHTNSPTIAGMVKKIEHLIAVRECKDSKTDKSTSSKSKAKEKIV